jgi:hypothetical protein
MHALVIQSKSVRLQRDDTVGGTHDIRDESMRRHALHKRTQVIQVLRIVFPPSQFSAYGPEGEKGKSLRSLMFYRLPRDRYPHYINLRSACMLREGEGDIRYVNPHRLNLRQWTGACSSENGRPMYDVSSGFGISIPGSEEGLFEGLSETKPRKRGGGRTLYCMPRRLHRAVVRLLHPDRLHAGRGSAARVMRCPFDILLLSLDDPRRHGPSVCWYENRFS